MKTRGHNYIYPIAAAVMLYSAIFLAFCANPIAPTGGVKDEAPPKLDSLNSTPNYQTNFKIKELSFTFDEWVVVKSPFQQVIVSPPLNVPLTLKSKGKTVVATFAKDEQLLDSTTYTINFGESIADLNEGNIVPNFKYVFSTGPIIDSLVITGSVKDGKTGEAEKNVTVMLYDRLDDSIFYLQKPVYFSKTDEAGNFTIENIRQDSFILRALKDENLNYLFDSEEERIGFLDTAIFITGFDSTIQNFDLILFDNQIPFRRSFKSDAAKGVYKVGFNQPIDGQILSVTTTLDELHRLQEKDTLYIWHQTPLTDSASVIIETADKNDTLVIRPVIDVSKRKFTAFTMRTWSPSSQPLRTPSDPIHLSFSNPIQSIDISFIEVMENDSVPFPSVQATMDATDPRKINVSANWKQETTYSWKAFPGAFTDIFSQKNDTLSFRMTNPSLKDFGNIILTATDLDSSKQYVFQLLDKEMVLATKKIVGDTIWTFTFTNLLPKTYSITFTEDLNRNGKWDTGNYSLKQYPERILKQDLSPLRASWDVEAEIRPSWNKKIIKSIK